MFHCPNCRVETDVFAPVCNECNNPKGIIETLFFDAVSYAIVFGAMYLAWNWLTSV